LLFFTTNSSPVSSSTNNHFSFKISSKISSFSLLIFQIHFTFGYSLLDKNGQNLPVFTTIVPPSGQGFHSYFFLKASNSHFCSSGWSIKSHSGNQLQPTNFPLFEYLYIKSFPHLGQGFQTFSTTFTAFSHAFSKSFFRELSQKS
jgi:hypothetical protein